MKKILLYSICSFVLGVTISCNVFVSTAVASEDTSAKSAASGTSKSSGMYGEPQKTIEAAQKYVKDTFFYSTREGDKIDGEPLTDTVEAMKRAKANRSAYHEEVVTATYAQANEELTTGAEQSKASLQKVVEMSGSAQTYDDKKAVGSLVAKISAQERVKRLSLDLALLELEAASFLKTMPLEYVIARSPDEIEAEAKTNINKGSEESKEEEKKGFFEQVKDKASSIMDSVRNTASGAMSKVKEVASKVAGSLNTETLKKAANKVVSVASDTVKTVSSAASNAVDKVKTVASDAMSKAKEAGLLNVSEKVKETASNAMDKIGQTASDAMTFVKDTASTAIKSANMETLKAAAGKVTDVGKDAVARIGAEASETVDKIKEFVPNVSVNTDEKETKNEK